MIESQEKIDWSNCISAHEAADLLGVSHRSIYTRLEARGLEGGRVGRTWSRVCEVNDETL